MGDRCVITDIRGMKEDIKAAFDVAGSRRGIFARRDDLEWLLRRVKEAIDEYMVFEPDPRTTPVKCDHKWRDFDWYIEYCTRNNGVDYTITEPYLCIHCGERKNVILEKGHIKLDDGDTEASIVSELINMYPKLRMKAIVEDEVHDAALVDREYLRIADYLRGNGELAREIKLKLGGADDGERSKV